MENVEAIHDFFKADSPPRAMVLHTKSGPVIFPFSASEVAKLVDPDRETLPWYPAMNKGCLHLVHEDFTDWQGPVSNNREKML